MSDKVKTDSASMKRLQLLEKSKTLPTKSGCYLLKKVSRDGENFDILYVGKAKNLRSRVGSYFNNSAKSPKTEVLVGHVTDFDFITTDNESEAFVLENNLIKKHYPKYNIRLKDDKTYPYISIDYNEVFPRIVYTRNPKRSKGVKVFGPFTTGSNIYEVSRCLTKSFKLRDCTLSEFKKRKRPCLLFDIKQCSAPCTNLINQIDYEKDLNFVTSFFSGNYKKALGELEERMFEAASIEEFELAAQIRDNLKLLSDFAQTSINQNVEFEHDLDIDVQAYSVGDIEIDISLYMVRKGIVLGHKNFHFPVGESEEENEEIFMNFLYQYYSSTNEELPGSIVTELSEGNLEILSNSFKEIFPEKINIILPKRKHEKIYLLTKEHAKENQRFRIKNEDSVWIGLNKLKELLSLKEVPRKLECYDIAIWQGDSPAASQIVFEDGVANKTKYRYYNLEKRPEGNNDFAMMKEVLTRRLRKDDLPDVFIVDGGKGQVSSFLAVLKEFQIEIPVIGIAKEKMKKKLNQKSTDINKTEERLIIPKRLNPYSLSRSPSLMKIIVAMRDEAHRFSRKLHHKKEKERVFSSWLDGIEGIGPKIKQKINEKTDFDFNILMNFEVEELKEFLNVNSEIAQKIKERLQGLKPTS